jgi:hypothetical protein
MPSRRRFLGALALGGLLAGCVNRAPSDGATDEPTTDGLASTTTAPTAPSSTTTADPAEGLLTEGAERTATDRGPLRPDGDPVSAERTITDPDLDYLPEQDAVRYPAYYKTTGRGPEGQPTRTTLYETTPFADWAATETASVAADRVSAVADERIDGDPTLSVGITKHEGEMAVTAQLTTTLDREGTVVSEPSVDFERAVAAVPRSVDTTIHFEGQTAERTVPVWVSEMTIQYD